MGAKSDVLEWIKESFCFVLSSDFEGLPNSLIEAMCMGIPCISTDCSPGGARELLRNDRGVVVPCGNKEELAKAINTFIENPEVAFSYGCTAFDVRKEIESKVIADKWITVMDKVVRGEKKV